MSKLLMTYNVPKMPTRHQQCLNALSHGNLTAREVSDYMYNNGFTAIRERNIAQPRLNELVKEGLVVVTGYAYDAMTKRDVKIYKKKVMVRE